MPNVTTHEVPAREVKKDDWMDGIAVTSNRLLAKNVDITFATGKTQRVPADRLMTVQRITPTWEETRKSLVEKLEAGVADVIRQVQDAGDDSSIRAKYANAMDLIYQLEWNVAGDLERLHTDRLLQELDRLLQDNPTADTIVKFVARIKKAMLEWSPGRSTSVVHNLSDDARFKAMKDIVSGSFGGHGISYVLWMVDALAKHDAMNHGGVK